MTDRCCTEYGCVRKSPILGAVVEAAQHWNDTGLGTIAHSQAQDEIVNALAALAAPPDPKEPSE